MIKDLKEGQRGTDIFLLKSKEHKQTTTGKNYADLIFCDKTGKILTKFWDCSTEQFNSLELSKLYTMEYRIDIWKDNLQMTIKNIRLAPSAMQERVIDYVESSPIEPKILYDRIIKIAQEIENKEIQNLVINIYSDYKEKLLYYPAAAKLHHSILGGLLYHVYRMLLNAKSLCAIYTSVNKDILYAGVILHDIEKTNELDSDVLGNAKYSKEGNLLGHIVMGINTIGRYGEKLGVSKEIITTLQHLIAAHHGVLEYGSPKLPAIVEAQMLYLIDLMDARVYDFEKAIENVPKGEFSEKIWSLENTKVYNPNL